MRYCQFMGEKKGQRIYIYIYYNKTVLFERNEFNLYI